ncbi:hypothetical protein FLONG3_4698 [Fusarium longipes]|uniref:Uncharacterized protein n=1 Tax=Fusarium longipes TaxID=694270 RepID=A0A395SXJ0_9HYPO|nr:hypothetical protein FLONG3_4698 [Fusarium longipes]
MSTTPPYSSSSPTKRKYSETGLDTIPLEILAAINNESRIELSGDNIKKQATKLKARVKRAVEDPKIDRDDLKDL